MPDVTLSIAVGGSVLNADYWDDLRPWAPLLNNADSIALVSDGQERVRVDLSGPRRWIAFAREVGAGSLVFCIGYQETVGALHRGGAILGGSNRKTLAWLHPGGRVVIGAEPGG
jgi:hypothetical protein